MLPITFRTRCEVRPQGWRKSVRIDQCNSIRDFRLLARRRLPGPIFHYIDGAADDEVTYRAASIYTGCDRGTEIICVATEAILVIKDISSREISPEQHTASGPPISVQRFRLKPWLASRR